MKLTTIVATLACCLFLNTFGGEVLYWMVDDAANVHYGDGSSVNIQTLVPDSFDTSLAARVRVDGNGITDGVFLDFYFGNPNNPYDAGEVMPGEFGQDFYDNGSGYWGCGVPTGHKSLLNEFSGPEFSFIIELGNYRYDEATDSDNWLTIATSASQSYSSLLNKGYVHTIGSIAPSNLGVWNPHDFYAIPEPSSSLLILMGIGLLALRRKNGNR